MLVVEVVEVFDHQSDNLRIVACVILGVFVVFVCLELDHAALSLLKLVSTMLGVGNDVVWSYLEAVRLESKFEVHRLTAQHDLVKVVFVDATNEFAVGKLLGSAKPVAKVSFDLGSGLEMYGQDSLGISLLELFENIEWSSHGGDSGGYVGG